MAYKQKADGGFRMRASFPVTPDLVMQANKACEIEGVSMYQLCRDALVNHCLHVFANDRMRRQTEGLPPDSYPGIRS